MSILQPHIDNSSPVSQNNLTPADYDKQLKKTLKATFPAPSWKKGKSLAAATARPCTAPGGMAAREAGCPILDIPTQESGKIVPRKTGPVKWVKNRVSRQVFSRTMLGLKLPGRYYFLTLTSSPESPPLKKSFDLLRKWLKSERPGISWIKVFTDEGHGVIHMVFRLPLKSKNIDVRHLRARWKKWHKATQIKIVRARSDHEKLADYLCDQRKMRKLGSEMSWQNSITEWGWSKGWIPKGFTKSFGRLWYDWIDAPPKIRDWAVSAAVQAAHETEKKELVKDGI